MHNRASRCAVAIAGVAVLLAPGVSHAQTWPSSPAREARCAWVRPPVERVVDVRSVAQLYEAIASARPATLILVHPGEYLLTGMLDLSTPGIVLAGVAEDAAAVVLRGAGMSEQAVGVALSIGASDITVANLTVGHVRFHGIQVRGERGASRLTIHNVHVIDTGQQLLKGSTDGGALHSDDVEVACSTFEYTTHAPSNYTNGVDVLAGRNWIVRDSRFLRIRGPAEQRWSAGPAILFWANSQGTQIERNLVLDSYRGIAFGLGPGASRELARDHEAALDHQGGTIRNNVVVNMHDWADEGIEANAAGTVAIDYNTVLTGGGLPWSIGLRFPRTTAWTRNNLTSKPVLLRDGGQGSLAGNIAGAAMDWFMDAGNGDVRLSGLSWPAVDAGVMVSGVTEDGLAQPRVSGTAPDAGAVEYGGPR